MEFKEVTLKLQSHEYDLIRTQLSARAAQLVVPDSKVNNEMLSEIILALLSKLDEQVKIQS